MQIVGKRLYVTSVCFSKIKVHSILMICNHLVANAYNIIDLQKGNVDMTGMPSNLKSLYVCFK